MENETIIVIMIISFLLMAYSGTPMAYALLAGALIGGILAEVTGPTIVAAAFNAVNTPALLAVPFFLLAAEIMNSSDTTLKIVRFVQTIVGHIRAGLAQVNAVFSMFFAGISGSSMADVAANSRILLPAMAREGYKPAESAALIAAASTIAHIIPPSIMGVVYGAVLGVSIAGLFLAGVVPGVMVGLGLMAYSYFFVAGGVPAPRSTLRQVAAAGAASLLPLLVPVLIMGGILTGVFTPTEAGMAAVVYIIVIVLPLTKLGHFKVLPADFARAGIIYSLPLISVAAASAFSQMFARLGGARIVTEWAVGFVGDNAILIMVTLVVMLMLVGQLVDAIPAIVLFAPMIKLFTDIGGMNPIQVGAVAIVTLAFGLITPPYGLSLLLAAHFAGVRFSTALRSALPLYLLFIIVIGLLITVPEITLWLPRLVVPRSAGCLPDPASAGFVCP